MFRTAGVVLLALLVIGVAAMGVGGWQLQRNLSARTEELSEQLASLTATQQAMLAQQRPPEITGRCYLGEPSKPAADVAIKIYRFPESRGTMGDAGIVVDVVRTGADGRFSTGALRDGDYCLLAPVQPPSGGDAQELYYREIQSRPIALSAGSGKVVTDLDLLASARIELIARDIPSEIELDDGTKLKVAFSMNLWSGHNGAGPERVFPANLNDLSPPITQWPVPFGYGKAQPMGSAWVPPREYRVNAMLSISGNIAAAPIVARRTRAALEVAWCKRLWAD